MAIAHQDMDKSALTKILEALEPHQEYLDSTQLDDLRQLQASFEKNLAAAREQGRALRIAVVGQMKAGKSSFLNAALLARDLLPRAATPMTAALTRIHHASSPSARVVFYSQEDWRAIEDEAQQAEQRLQEEKQKWRDEVQHSKPSPFGMFAAPPQEPDEAQLWQRVSMQLRASRELVQQVRKNQLSLNNLLGSEPEITAANQDELASRLRDYIGAQGDYTPLVKMIELYVDDPRIEGMEIVDTPGFNDPVLSRGSITRKFLGQCDVIYLFSTVSQFLAEADLALLREQLPSDGIKSDAIFIVGSRRDEALRQDGNLIKQATQLAQKKAPNQLEAAKLSYALQLADRKTQESGKQAIERQLQHAREFGDQRSLELLQHLAQSTPHCVAAQFALWADKMTSLDENEIYHIKHLENAMGQKLSAADLRQVANIEPLQQGLLEQRQRKQELLTQKEQALCQGLHEDTHKRLQEMLKTLGNYAESVSQKSIAELENQRRESTQRLNAGRSRIEDVFDAQCTQIQHDFARLKLDFQELASNSVRIENRTDTKQESYTVSTSSWYKPWSWGDTETRYRTITTRYAEVQDAVEGIDRFAQQTQRDVSEQIMRCINQDQLRKSINQAALALFDLGDANFDAENMKLDIRKSLRRLTIPNVTLTPIEYSERLTRQFGSTRVTEAKIDDLRDQARAVIKDILKDIEISLDKQLKGITAGLNEAGTTLVTQLIADIEQSIDKLRSAIEDKENTLRAIEQAQTTLNKLLAQHA